MPRPAPCWAPRPSLQMSRHRGAAVHQSRVPGALRNMNSGLDPKSRVSYSGLPAVFGGFLRFRVPRPHTPKYRLPNLLQTLSILWRGGRDCHVPNERYASWNDQLLQRGALFRPGPSKTSSLRNAARFPAPRALRRRPRVAHARVSPGGDAARRPAPQLQARLSRDAPNPAAGLRFLPQGMFS